MSFNVVAATGFPGQVQSVPQAPNPALGQTSASLVTPPVQPPTGSDRSANSTEARADDGAQGRSEARPSPRKTLEYLSSATPYVAPPTVDAEAVAAELERAMARERAAGAEPDADRGADLAVRAEDREANAAAIAQVQPVPENAPNLREDAETIRAAEAARDAQAASAPEPQARPAEG